MTWSCIRQRVMGWNRRFRRDETGASAVEFAVTLPILVAMMVAMSDLGLAVNEKMRLTSAVRAGTQSGYGNVGNTAAIIQAVKDASGESTAALTVTATTSCACADGSAVACDGSCSGGSVHTYLTVTATEAYSLLIHYPGFSGPTTLSATSVLRVQ